LLTTMASLLLDDDAVTTAAGAGAIAFGGIMMLICLAIGVVCIIGMWKMFEKCGQPGWAAIVPFYNIYILLKVAGRPGWWLLLMLIPLVNLVFVLLLSIDIAKSFGQSAVFGVVLIFLLGGIGYVILGFGNYSYVGPAAATAA